MGGRVGGFPEGTKAARLLRGEALHPASPNPWMPSEGGQLLPKGFLVTQTWGVLCAHQELGNKAAARGLACPFHHPGPQHASSCRTWPGGGEGGFWTWKRKRQEPTPFESKGKLPPHAPEGHPISASSSFPCPPCLKLRVGVQKGAKGQGRGPRSGQGTLSAGEPAANRPCSSNPGYFYSQQHTQQLLAIYDIRVCTQPQQMQRHTK